MLYGFIGRVSNAHALKSALDVSAERTRAIAARVSQASIGGDGFALPAPPAMPAPGTVPTEPPVDLETEMVSLADEQLHFEATAKLLEKTYQRLRSVIRSQ